MWVAPACRAMSALAMQQPVSSWVWNSMPAETVHAKQLKNGCEERFKVARKLSLLFQVVVICVVVCVVVCVCCLLLSH